MEKICNVNVGNKFDIFMSLHVTEVTVDRETNRSLFCFCVYVMFEKCRVNPQLPQTPVYLNSLVILTIMKPTKIVL